MNKSGLFLVLVLCIVLFPLSGCDTGGPGPAGVQQFQTDYGAGAYAGFGMGAIDPYVGLTLSSFNYAPCTDPTTNYFVTTDANGNVTVSLTCLPGDVVVTRNSSANCPNNGLPFTYRPAYIVLESSPYYLPCGISTFAPGVRPGSIDLNTAPATVSVQYASSVFDSTYGLPVIYYYDSSGNFLTSENAVSAASDGTSVVVDTSPVLASGYAGTYGLGFFNKSSTGSLVPVATAGLVVTDITPPGGGGCGGDICGDQP